MTTTQTLDSSRARERTPETALSLDDLARRPAAELEALYREGHVPDALDAVDGPLRGRMLAVVRLDRGPIARALRRFSGSRSFVWAGKTFHAERRDAGRGINRVVGGSVLGRQDLFPFHTSFAPSRLDGGPSIVLDYDLPENPPYIRRIHDEIREVSPGIYLGPAMWKHGSGATTVLWFALDTGRR